MSWFTSFFSSPKPIPASPATTQASIHEKRILEEPKPSPEPVKQDPAPEQKSLSQTKSSTVERPNRNKIIFGAGLTFFAFSILITRRSFARKRLAASPAFYTNAPGHNAAQGAKVNGAMEALEALNIATINVLSVAMMAAGGSLWYLDINDMTDARRVLRGGLGVDGTGKSEKDAEEEFEEWLATTLARKEAKAVRNTSALQDGAKGS